MATEHETTVTKPDPEPIDPKTLARARIEASEENRLQVHESTIALRILLSAVLSDRDRLEYGIARATALRDQARSLCSTRTAELQRCKAIIGRSAEHQAMGHSLDGLLAQIDRLRGSCKNSAFWTVRTQLDELRKCAINIEDAESDTQFADAVMGALSTVLAIVLIAEIELVYAMDGLSNSIGQVVDRNAAERVET